MFISIPVDANISGHIGLDLPWYSNTFLGIILGFVLSGGSWLIVERYENYKKRNQQKQQLLLQLTSKGGILIDLFRIFLMHKIVAEELRLQLELDKSVLDINGMNKIDIDRHLSSSITFILYRDAKDRVEEVKLQLSEHIDHFWTTVNRIPILFPNKKELNSKGLDIGNAMIDITNYKLKCVEFSNALQSNTIEEKTATEKKEPFKWRVEEQIKNDNKIEDDKRNLENFVKALHTKIGDLQTYLRDDS